MQSVLTELFADAMVNYAGLSEKEELDYVDLLYPKVSFILGTQGIIDISRGKNLPAVLEKNGLSENDYKIVLKVIEETKKAYDAKPTLDNLKMINEQANQLLGPIVSKVAYQMQVNGVPVNDINADINNFFGNDSRIFTPVEELEKAKKM